MKETTIAFLGLGEMGQRMASRLVNAGYTLAVYNRTSARAEELAGANVRVESEVREAVGRASVIVSMVTDDDASEALWLHPTEGAIHALAPGAIVMECSTVTPGWAARLGERVRDRGARFIDAPVVGSTPQAAVGELLFLLGGEPEDVAAIEPLVMAMGKRAIHVGGVSHGASMKLIVNSLFASQVALMAELLKLSSALGLDPAEVREHLSTMPVTSPAASSIAALMLAHDHAPRFPVDLVIKDLRYSTALGALPVTRAALEQFEATASVGRGAENLSAVYLDRE